MFTRAGIVIITSFFAGVLSALTPKSILGGLNIQGCLDQESLELAFSQLRVNPLLL